MSMFKRVLLVLAIALCCAAGWGAGAEEDYAIKLERTLQEGRPLGFRKVVAMKRERHSEIDGRALPARTEVQAVEFHGQFTILELDEKGHEKRNAYTVEKFVVVEEEKERVLLRPGAKFTATRGKDQTTFDLEKGKVSEEQQRYLQMVIDMRDDDGPTTEEVYGTAQRKKVGETWKADAAKLAKAYSSEEMKVKADDAEGQVKLLGVEEKEGVKCLKLRLETNIKHYDYAPADAPEGFVFKGGKRLAVYEGLVPIDLKSAVAIGTVQSTDEMNIEQPGPREGTVVKSRVVTEYSYVHEVRELEGKKEKEAE